MDEALDYVSYLCLAAAVMIMAFVVRDQERAVKAMAEDIRYLKDNALTREDEVRPT